MLVTEKSDFSCTENVIQSIPKFDFGLFSPDILNTYNLDMDCDLPPEEDFLQQLSNDLEIPMLLEESQHSIDKDSKSLMEPCSLMSELDSWGTYSVFDNAPDTDIHLYKIKEEIKLEPDSPQISPVSPNSQGSCDSWPSPETKFVLETPPISPPQAQITADSSPPSSPTPTLSVSATPSASPKEPVIVVNGNNIKIVPLTTNINSLKIAGRQTKVILPRQNATPSLIIQPQPPSTPVPPTVNVPQTKTEDCGSTILLTQEEFAALSNQGLTVAQNNLKNTQTSPAVLRVSNQSIQSCIKQEPGVRQDIQQLKALKRQQRMIKNRESACLSRKKKKEYVTSLESQITQLRQENVQLKLENEALKARLSQLEDTTEMNSYKNNGFLKGNVKKTSAILAVLLMVSINLGSISLLSREKTGADAELSVPNHYLKHHGRSLLWAEPEIENVTSTYTSGTQPTCPLHINETESLRLDSELRRWIGVDDFSSTKQKKNGVEEFYSGKLRKVKNKNNSNGANVTRSKPSTSKSVNDLFWGRNEKQLVLRQTSLFSSKHRRKLRKARKENKENNAVQLMSVPHAGLLEALRRRDDTFYVVSFSGDHLLLPALAHNNTLRPKMSLVLPALPFNESVSTSSSVTMMQIDCEVLDTRLIELQERDIPLHLRQRNAQHSPSSQHKNVSNDESLDVQSRSYRPYFLRSPSAKRQDEFDSAHLSLDPYSTVYRTRDKQNTFP